MTEEQLQRRIEDAQNLTEIEVAGEMFDRVPYGSETGMTHYAECPNCACRQGLLHIFGCDTEACPRCGETLLGACNCDTVVH